MRCGDRTAAEADRRHRVQVGRGRMYHYTESGLDNVWLENGYRVHSTAYGEGISITSTEDLHRAIGHWLIGQPKPLNGAELRFIRLEMELTQKQLAEIIGAEEQAVRRWEKHRTKDINDPADRLLRILYNEFVSRPGASARRMTDRLVQPEDRGPRKVSFHETGGGWQVHISDLAA
jgi:putative transcriptional regulator